jgi:hypothetical protein
MLTPVRTVVSEGNFGPELLCRYALTGGMQESCSATPGRA